MITLPAALETIRVLLNAKPLELYDIYLGSQTAEDANTLYYANFYKSTNFFTYIGESAQAYTPIGVRRTPIKRSSQGEIESVTFSVDNVNQVVSSYAASHDFRNKRIVARLVFRDQLSSADNSFVVFDGLIQSISFWQKKKTRTVKIIAKPKMNSLNIETGWPYEIPCNCKFGDTFCAVDKDIAANKVSGTATGGSTSTLIDTTNLDQADDYWNYGQVNFTSGDNDGDKRKIIDFDNATKTATLDYALPNTVSAGDTFDIFRGCDKTLDMCTNTYSNDANYHGFHSIPLTK